MQDKTVAAATEVVENYFWEAPAASSYNYHNPYCCGERGLWIHTLMVATAYERLVETYVQQGRISSYEADLGRIAVVMHDMQKYAGKRVEHGAAKNHDIHCAELIRNDTDLPERVAEAVETHMGPWYDGPEPETDLQHLVHNADMIGSTKNGTMGIYNKPKEIKELYPSIPEADL